MTLLPDTRVTTDLEVEVTGGRVRGVAERGMLHWRGIPYATAERLRVPGPVEPWEGVRDASRFGPIPFQLPVVQATAPFRVPRSEDCLSINVIAPDAPAATARPVMVFIHGGAYTTGSSREIPRLGEALVRDGDVLFVNFNYRLGALGYLDFSGYASEEHPFASNLGLRDQVAALAWVRDNVAAFGGDPDNVTVFGESAGGNAVTTLITVPAARGLFARGVSESGSPEAVYPQELTREWGADFVDILREVTGDTDTDTAELLESTPADTLVRAAAVMRQRTQDAVPGTIAFSPVIDGDFLPERPVDAVAAGRSHHVPLIIGTNAREGSLFRGRLDLLATTRPRIRAVFGKTERAARSLLFAQYRALPPRVSAAEFGGDYTFWYPSIRYAEGHSRFAPVHFYRFDIATRALRYAGLDATHGIELFAVFDLVDTPVGRAAGILGGRASFKRTGERVRRRWTGFARGEGPGDDWAPYTPERRATLIIDAEDRVELDPRRDRRLAWQAFVPHL